jgi:intracellular multiplication protein IcmB
LFKTKVGFIVQILTNTVGPIELWAFSTTAEDVALRNRLYKRLGTYPARMLLAEHFPLGSARATLDHMRANANEFADDSIVEALAQKLEDAYRKKLLKEIELAL